MDWAGLPVCLGPLGGRALVRKRLCRTEYLLPRRPAAHGSVRANHGHFRKSATAWGSQLAGISLALLGPTAAHAQNASTTLIPPAIAPDYRRDRNVGVLDRPHPDFDPLGYRVGSFIVNPALTISPGFSDNVYSDNANKKSDAFVILEPFVRVGSDWSAHRVALEMAGDIRRFKQATIRNQNGWNVAGSGRVDVSQDLIIEAQGQIGRRFESPYSDDVVANTRNLSSYIQSLASLKASYTAGRTRLVAGFDRSSYEFNKVTFADRPARDQRTRDRTMNRFSGIVEYALSPSISAYGEIIVDQNNYKFLLANGEANRDSSGYALLGGSNFDLAGLMRGSVGVGYSTRNYKADLYPDASGLSIQAKIEFFPSPITTVGVAAQRQIQDAGLGGMGAYSDNRASIRIDHELLENLILTVDADVSKRSYFESDEYTNVFSAGAAAKFQMTRSLSFGGNIRYGSSSPHGENLGNPFDEWRAIVSIRLRR